MDVRSRVEMIAFSEELQHDPFMGGKVQKLWGHTNYYYKIRVGDYRMG
ncbi:MAG: hypothetical protein R2880_08675 [Deinococcales bacterium]